MGWHGDLPRPSAGLTVRYVHPTPCDGGESGGEDIYRTGASGHAEYDRAPLQRMTGFNLATILLDRPDLAARETP